MKNKKPSQLIENKIYAAVAPITEEREASGAYRGNGHHLAQDITKAVSIALLSPNRRKVYDALTSVPTRVKDISKIIGRSSRTISSELVVMNKETLLVSFKQEGRFKLWYKNN